MASRLERLQARRLDPTVMRKSLYEEYANLQEDPNVKFVVGAMQPIDEAYTEKSFEEGNRVAEQIRKTFNLNGVEVPKFAFQGSVTSDTHIKAYSDIDLLVVEQRFLYAEPPHNRPPYSGDAITEFAEVREHCADIVEDKFPAVLVDKTPGKSIKMAGGSNVSGSLARNVDIVIAAWWDTQAYMTGNDIAYRGVAIFDSATKSRIYNQPFLHNLRIDQKDAEVSGSLRKVIRFLKSVIADAEQEIDVSSYDAAAIGYSMDKASLTASPGMELVLMERTRLWLETLCQNEALRAGLLVPNETRKIFGVDGASFAGLKALYDEVTSISNDIKFSVTSRVRKLEEARLQIPSSLAKGISTSKFDRSRLVF